MYCVQMNWMAILVRVTHACSYGVMCEGGMANSGESHTCRLGNVCEEGLGGREPLGVNCAHCSL